MAKDIQDTTAYKSLGAWVVLDKKGKHVATVLAHYASSGGVTVNVSQWGDEQAERTARAMGIELDEEGKIAKGRHAGEWPYKVANRQSGHAGGYGYDKFTAALSGLVIDGHVMSDHCRGGIKRPKSRLWQDSDKAKLLKKGYRLSNWSSGVQPGETRHGRPVELNRYGREGVADTESGYVSAFRIEGLGYLEAMGYRVIKAV